MAQILSNHEGTLHYNAKHDYSSIGPTSKESGKRGEKAIEQMEEEEELNTEDEDYEPETTSKESSRRGGAPTCNGEVCKVKRALGISG